MQIGVSPLSQVQIRAIRGEHSEGELEALLARTFPVLPGKSLFDDFPVWRFPVDKLQLGAYVGEKLVSTASVRLANVSLSAIEQISAALIGCVATDEKWRGKGLASVLVEGLIDWSIKRKADLAVLWGSEEKMYKRLGFSLKGTQARVVLSDLSLSSSASAQVHKAWNPRIFDCLKSRECGLSLSMTDLKWIEAHKNITWYWMGTKQEITAYAAVGKGIDLAGMIHEWGGEQKALYQLLHTLQKENPSLQLLGHPEQLSRFAPASAMKIEYLCMARGLNPKMGDLDAIFRKLWFWGLDSV